MNKRDLLLNLLDTGAKPERIPAAFFLHFDPAYHRGQAAIEKHLEFFHYTGMDMLKIQFELPFPKQPQIQKPKDWKDGLPFFDIEHYQPVLDVVEGLVKAARKDALVILTLYSPFMICSDMVGKEMPARHIEEDPDAFNTGMARMTESLLQFVRACMRLGLDGFYASTQGGEKGRLSDPALFDVCVRPFDLVLMNEIDQKCIFNILHVCDYHMPYADYSRFIDYPGHVVSASLHLADGAQITAHQASELFRRPFIGGLDRKGAISTGTPGQVRQAALAVLGSAPERFMLGADCTVLPGTPWHNLRLAIQTAHEYRRSK